MTFIKIPRLYSVDEFPWPNPYQEIADKWRATLNALDTNSLYPHTIKAIKIPSSRQPSA